MIQMLDIHEGDLFLDLCAGTGSFALEALELGASVVTVEYQTKLFNLLKCNFILRNIDQKKYQCIKGDCFDFEFKAMTKSAINPPYGMRDKRELDFVLRQIECCAESGLFTAIIPLSCLNAKSAQRLVLYQTTKIRAIIICNNKLFYPSAGIKCCIILCEKHAEGNTGNRTKIIDYSDDGYEIRRMHGRCRGAEAEVRYAEVLEALTYKKNNVELQPDADWITISMTSNTTICRNTLLADLAMLDYHSKVLRAVTHETIECDRMHRFSVGELFDAARKPLVEYHMSNGARVHLIAAKNNNNGIKSSVLADKATFSGNMIVVVTGGDGGAGMVFYQEMPFKLSSATTALIPKAHVTMDKYFGIYCANQLSNYKKIYSRGYSWTTERLMRDQISIPCLPNNEIDYQYIRDLFCAE